MAPTPDVLVDYDEIARVATAMGSKLTDISAELRNLETTVSGLLQDGLVFEEAGPALRDAYTDFSNQMKTSAKNIQEYANTFNDILQSLSESDQAIATDVTDAANRNG
ncbi:WXG100 family type VII secretion target [Streptomyces sp. NPDC002514]|uniref:hypothetical protein n=1 Tax=unclassified Streptomyces TaxID=2593676 RepID=UPI0036ABDBA1